MRLIALPLLLVLAALAGGADLVGALTEGGSTSPDGKTAATCDLPVELRQRNVGGRDGAGLCVFTSIEHAARYQNERRLWDLQKDMRKEPGGGYPEKVDAMIRKYGKDTQYIQHTGGDLEFLKAALATGRMVCVTYCGHDPHYGEKTIAHMVNLVYLDDSQACILDNNYIGANQLVWMSVDDFAKRWRGTGFYVMTPRGRQPIGGGWAVVLLNGPPPPPVKL